MSESKPVKFEYRSGEPGIIEVEATDGTRYIVKVGAFVLGVAELDTKDQAGLPQFEVQVNVAFHTSKKQP